jgi:hypothetical protein
MSDKLDSVLVVIGCTAYNQFSRHLYPKFYNALTYENKRALLVDQEHYPEIKGYTTPESVMAAVREVGIKIARTENFDWIFQMDLESEPEPDTIQKLLAVNYPLVGGLMASRGGAWQVNGHNYADRKTLTKEWLTQEAVKDNAMVDFIGGGCLLIARGIYFRVDYLNFWNFWNF